MKPKLITYNGKSQTIKAWARETGIPARVIEDRLYSHWSIQDALTKPTLPNRSRRYEWNGNTYTVRELAKLHGNIAEPTMRERLKHMTVEEAMTMKNQRPHRKARITEQAQKRVFVPIKRKKIDTTQCKTCQYRGFLSNSETGVFCAYALITRQCRSSISPPSPHCTEYKRGRSIYRRVIIKQLQRGVITYEQ